MSTVANTWRFHGPLGVHVTCQKSLSMEEMSQKQAESSCCWDQIDSRHGHTVTDSLREWMNITETRTYMCYSAVTSMIHHNGQQSDVCMANRCTLGGAKLVLISKTGSMSCHFYSAILSQLELASYRLWLCCTVVYIRMHLDGIFGAKCFKK